MNTRQCIVTVVLAAFLGSAGKLGVAGEVEGAFGFRFGEYFPELTSGWAATSEDDGTISVFNVRPPVPNPNLDSYSLKLFPETRLIYKISATKNFTTWRDCIALNDFVVDILTKKYGELYKNQRAISASCNSMSGDGFQYEEPFRFEVSYTDFLELEVYLTFREAPILPVESDSGL